MRALYAPLHGLLAVVMLASTAQAAPRYPSVQASEFPQPTWLSDSRELSGALFPDLAPGTLPRDEYSEVQPIAGRNFAVVTLSARQSAYVSLLHYTPQRQCFMMRRALPLQNGTDAALTFELPAGAGLTRLLVWDKAPGDDLLLQLARHPNFTTQSVAGVLAQRWYPRAAEVDSWPLGPLPWENPFEPAELRYLTLPTDLDPGWPLISAYLGGDLRVRTKDCAVLYSGIPTLQVGRRGALGVWPLGWGSELELSFELPEDRSLMRASLRLEPFGGLPESGAGELEVRVNGWLASSESTPLGLDSASPGPSYQVGPYLQAGGNSIELRRSGLGGSDWELAGLALWVQ
jgi:hypothetical protein